MDDSILPPNTKELFLSLTNDMLPIGSYLSGGTALALRLGHRFSNDLDLFTDRKFAEQAWEQKLFEEIQLNVTQRDWQTIIGEARGVKFSLFYYANPLIRPLDKYHQIPIASLEDIGAVKLDVITRRAAKRDYVDIYFIAKKYGIEKMFEWYEEKFGNIKERSLMLRKALIYFNDADGDEMPKMKMDCNWEEAKNYLRQEVARMEA